MKKNTLIGLYQMAKEYRGQPFGDEALLMMLNELEPLLLAMVQTACAQGLIRSKEDGLQEARLICIESLDTYHEIESVPEPDNTYIRFLCDSIQSRFEASRVQEQLFASRNSRLQMEATCASSKGEKMALNEVLHLLEVNGASDDLLVIIDDNQSMSDILAAFIY